MAFVGDSSAIGYPVPSMRFDFMRKSKESNIFTERTKLDSVQN
jgi:hypothetical protein